jgi:hypothetical protein
MLLQRIGWALRHRINSQARSQLYQCQLRSAKQNVSIPEALPVTNGRCELFALLQDALGDNAEPVIHRIKSELGGSRVYIPANDAADRQRALKLLRQGMSVDDVASRLGYHRTTVYRWWRARPTLPARHFARSEWEL